MRPVRPANTTDMFPVDWPAALVAYLRTTCGASLTLHRLGGMSQGRVWRATFAQTSVIVKLTAHQREIDFYTSIARQLAEAAVGTPRLLWVDQMAAPSWLVLEDIRELLPRERRLADAAQLAALRNLHTVTLTNLESVELFRPAWTGEMTRAALDCFPRAERQPLRPLLDRLREDCRPLFAPRCWISGDPNPANWGVRSDGSLVLYDWERFGRGTPALDLAITCPGLGDAAAFTAIAQRYLNPANPSDAAVQQLARAIALAKVWNVVEFLSFAAQGDLPVQGMIEWIVAQFRAWLHRTSVVAA